jgi:signal transduction histidine kinase
MQLPATAPPVLGDPDLIGQAVLNLFSNAVKYSSPETTITLELRTKAEEIVITVRDQGFGISESSQARLFTKFFRATDDPRVRADAGTGLGLAFAKEIVQQHGGKIGMESHLNAGSTFWFSLPI